jgi:hypothetical protein
MLINTSGDPIHVWSMQHGIKWKDEDSESQSDSAASDSNPDPASHSEAENEDVHSSSSSEQETEEGPYSDEDEWREVETDTSFEGSEILPSDIMSDDSEDTPYHYVHQLDIDFVNSDLEVSDE